ncbi:hypothetical protein Xbed_01099 [Xenorhabdus beddingii]|uniref:Uncharacterized protein n=1 Tax=Xenorhabdus beddingii TaxID=40578 RepID=A0A1Y2SQ17_9GAMM|nr:hypothetical protein Xbed_01099 [Xenorhabdus beddingii]
MQKSEFLFNKETKKARLSGVNVLLIKWCFWYGKKMSVNHVDDKSYYKNNSQKSVRYLINR